MSKSKRFPLYPAGSEIEIFLKVRAGGETYGLVHVFREPTAADKKIFWGRISRSELAPRKEGEPGGDYLEANEQLYDRCILRVEGYALPAGAPETEPGSLKETIPLEHKLWAVEELLARAGTLSVDTVKN